MIRFNDRNRYYVTSGRKLTTKLIDGKVLITRVTDDSLRDQGMKRGMKIVAINEMNPLMYTLQYVAPYVYASTPQDHQLQIFSHNLLSGNISEPVRIEAEDLDGKRVRYSIGREPWLMEEEMLTGNPLEFRIAGAKAAASSGNPLIVQLPGEGVALVCTKQDFSPDDREYAGFGIDPDIEVIPSTDDIIQNNDPVLQTAINMVLK
jgi:hypothetical protein